MERRAVLAGALALGACGRGEAGERGLGGVSLEAPTAAPVDRSGPIPALRELAPFPIGTEVMTADLDTPGVAPLAARQFSQITPGFELKMEVVLRPDFSLDFVRADRIADWAQSNGQRFHATTLIWFLQDPEAFKRLDGDRRAFGAAYDRYIAAVLGRYRGRAVGWDCVNEPLEREGEGLRRSRWSSNLGEEDHIVRAFEQAHAADPHTLLFLNEEGLEIRPAKRQALQRLIERLLKRGAPVGGIGIEGHIGIDQAPGQSTATLRELARFGLPIHVSEHDCSLEPRTFSLRGRAEKLQAQARLTGEMLDAFCDLPAAQRYAFTLWGVRDDLSWLNVPPYTPGADAPLPFDPQGRPKPAFDAMVARLRA